MKKTVLVLITFALIIAVAGSGFWLVHYFIDSREQKETYETLAEEFVLESTPTPESTTPAENSSPWHRKIPIAWGGSPSQTQASTTLLCGHRMTRSIICAGISTVNPPAEGHPSWMVATLPRQRARI